MLLATRAEFSVPTAVPAPSGVTYSAINSNSAAAAAGFVASTFRFRISEASFVWARLYSKPLSSALLNRFTISGSCSAIFVDVISTFP